MREEYYMPIWIKAILGFALVVGGMLCTFLVFRFVPLPKESGIDGFGSLMMVFTALGAILVLFVLGLIFDRRHPYTLFSMCMGLFLVLLVLIRWLAV